MTKPKIGVVSGSFDPITMGHIYVIEKALTVVDKLHVLIATNPSKKYFFTDEERGGMVYNALNYTIKNAVDDITVEFLPHTEFTAIYAAELGASTIFRGIRNVVDFEYEHSQDLFNTSIAPSVTTMYIMPPPELIQVSSSMVKSMIGMRDWQDKVSNYMPKNVIAMFEHKMDGL